MKVSRIESQPTTMKVVALISGGKDSCYNLMCCQQHGHEIVALANLFPPAEGARELDSYMYQSVGAEGIKVSQKTVLVVRKISRKSAT